LHPNLLIGVSGRYWPKGLSSVRFHCPLSCHDVVIIGGGLAGWLAAIEMLGAQQRVAADTGREAGKVIVLRAPGVPPIGVGESATGMLPNFLRREAIDWREFVRAAKATFKLGTRFDCWAGHGSAYWSPIDNPDAMLGLPEAGASSVSQRAAMADGEPLHRAHLHGWLMPHGKVPAICHPDEIEWLHTTSWHFDAGAAAQFMERMALERGALLVECAVRGVERQVDGRIGALRLDDGCRIEAGLFLDCSGQRRLLAAEDDWRDLTGRIPVARAIAGFMPHRDRMPPYTRAIAARHGWIWEIPTRDRLGVGYVHAPGAVAPEDARAELVRHCGSGFSPGPVLDFAAGYRRRPWSGNGVAIGLAAGFLEPLEATSIHTALMQIAMVRRAIVGAGGVHGAVAQVDVVDRFNRLIADLFEDFADFLLVHYAHPAPPTPFWRNAAGLARESALHAACREAAAGFPEDRALQGRSGLLSPNLVLPTLAGLGLLARPPAPPGDALRAARRMRALHRAFAAAALPHEAALALIHDQAALPGNSFEDTATRSEEMCREAV
jgi:tryptophan halogenase